MKNTKVALFAVTAALALSPLAFSAPMTAFSITGTPGVFDLTGDYTTNIITHVNTVVTPTMAMPGSFTETGTPAGGTTNATYTVVAPPVTKPPFETTKNDNHFTESDNPFDASGLLIRLTSGTFSGDYVYINGINGVDSNQIDVSIFKTLTSKKAIATMNYYVTNNDIPKTPEPSSLLLLGGGLLSLAGLVFWKSRSSANSSHSLTL
jgi:hypothetical protein